MLFSTGSKQLSKRSNSVSKYAQSNKNEQKMGKTVTE